MICLNENKQAFEVLRAVSMSGCYPVQAMSLIPHESRSYLYQTIEQLRKEKYVSEIGKGDIKGLRLLKKGIEALYTIHPKAVEQYLLLTDNGTFPSARDRRLRTLRIAEAIQLMRIAAVKTAVWEKPALRNIYRLTAVQPSLPLAVSSPVAVEDPAVEKAAVVRPAVGSEADGPPFFYTSKELKRSDVDGIYRTSFTRLIGMYVTKAGWYGVFNLGNGLCEWNTGGEIKSCNLMRMACQSNGWRSFMPELDVGSNADANSIIIARKPDVAVRVMQIEDESRGGVHFEPTGRSKRNRYIRLDETYTKTYFVPADRNGARLLRILALPDFQNRICAAALPESVRSDSRIRYTMADGKNESGEYFCLFFDSELRHLRGFRDNMSCMNVPLSKCMVACFPWQEPIVRAYLGNEVHIKTLEMETVENAIGIGNDEKA